MAQPGTGWLDNVLVIASLLDGRVLTVSNPATQGSSVVQQFYQGEITQHWLLVDFDATTQSLAIQSVATGEVINVQGANTAAGTAAIAWPKTGTANARWVLTDAAGDGSVVIQSMLNQFVLNVKGAIIADGTPVILWPKTATSNARWQLACVDVVRDPNSQTTWLHVPTFVNERVAQLTGSSTADPPNQPGDPGWENSMTVNTPAVNTGQEPRIILSLGKDYRLWGALLSGLIPPSPVNSGDSVLPLAFESFDMIDALPTGTTLFPVMSKPTQWWGDNQLTLDITGNPLAIRQTALTASPNALKHAHTGAEMTYLSKDGGATWAFGQMMDPADTSVANGKFFKPKLKDSGDDLKAETGFDRPEVHRARDLSGTYLTFWGAGDKDTNAMLWQAGADGTFHLEDSSIEKGGGVWWMTSGAHFLILIGWQGDDTNGTFPWSLQFRLYETKPKLTFQKDVVLLHQVVSYCVSGDTDQCVNVSVAHANISQNGERVVYFRVGYPSCQTMQLSATESYKRQIYNIQTFQLNYPDMSVFPVGKPVVIYPQSPKGSIREVVCVESELATLQANSGDYYDALYYWRETERTGSSEPDVNWGAVSVRGRMVRGLNWWSPVFDLATDHSGQPRTYTGYKLTGDYTKGAYTWYVSPTTHAPEQAGHRFIAQWIEPSTTTVGHELHLCVVTTA